MGGVGSQELLHLTILTAVNQIFDFAHVVPFENTRPRNKGLIQMHQKPVRMSGTERQFVERYVPLEKSLQSEHGRHVSSNTRHPTGRGLCLSPSSCLPLTWPRNEIYGALKPPPKEKGAYLWEAAPPVGGIGIITNKMQTEGISQWLGCAQHI